MGPSPIFTRRGIWTHKEIGCTYTEERPREDSKKKSSVSHGESLRRNEPCVHLDFCPQPPEL